MYLLYAPSTISLFLFFDVAMAAPNARSSASKSTKENEKNEMKCSLLTTMHAA